MSRFRIKGTCKREECKTKVTVLNKSGYCRKHRYLTNPSKPFDRVRFKAWLDASPENHAKYRAAIKVWAVRNPKKIKASDSAYQKRKRVRNILAVAALAKAKPSTPSPHLSNLLKLAEARASQARYGIEQIGNREYRR